jgi:hypothetical protein
MSIKTMLPQLCDINLASSKFILEKYTNYLEYLGDFVDQIETALKYRDTFFDNDSVKNRIKFFDNLQSKFETFSDDFVAYWYEIYRSNPDFIKSEVNNNTLKLDSDSIGKFTNSTYIIDDSISPISDWSMNSSPPPSYIPYNTLQKISPWTKQMIERASFRTTNMYRSNIVMVQPQDTSPRRAHGTNLVTDELYYTRTVSEIKRIAVEKITKKFEKEIKILLRYCNINDNEALNYQDTNQNKSYIGQYTFEIDVERVRYQVDVLSNRIKFLKSRISNEEVLSSEKIATVNIEQKSTSQLDRIYKNNLLTRLDQLVPRNIYKTVSVIEQTKIKPGSETFEELNANVANTGSAQTTPKQNIPTTFQHYPDNVSLPTYQAPQWVNNFSQCLGVGSTLDIFEGAVDPLTNFANASSTDFDLFGALSKINPFEIDLTGFNIEPDELLQQLQQALNSFDISSISLLFGSNFPVPSLTLGELFDSGGKAGDLKESALKQAQDSALDTIKDQTLNLLNSLVCGTAQNVLAGRGGGFGPLNSLTTGFIS